MCRYLFLPSTLLMWNTKHFLLVIASGLYDLTENKCFWYDHGKSLKLFVNKARAPLPFLPYCNFCNQFNGEICCLWQCVTADSFIPCLVDLCKALWGIMNSYHQVVSWHQRKDSQKLSAGETDMILLLIQSDTVFSNIRGLTFMLPSI
jgi:hypothetical protein